MAREIERKYLVKNLSYKKLARGVLFRQGYLSTNSEATVRVRIIGDRAYLTIKGANKGLGRLEYEYELPLEDANEIMDNLCLKPIIEKYRYRVEHEGHVWEVDEFLGENEGLVVAEIELEDEEEEFTKPDFIGEEVTGDHRYSNSNLVARPFKYWKQFE